GVGCRSPHLRRAGEHARGAVLPGRLRRALAGAVGVAEAHDDELRQLVLRGGRCRREQRRHSGECDGRACPAHDVTLAANRPPVIRATTLIFSATGPGYGLAVRKEVGWRPSTWQR